MLNFHKRLVLTMDVRIITQEKPELTPNISRLIYDITETLKVTRDKPTHPTNALVLPILTNVVRD